MVSGWKREYTELTIVSVLGRAIGIELFDTAAPEWPDNRAKYRCIEPLLSTGTRLPASSVPFTAATLDDGQVAISLSLHRARSEFAEGDPREYESLWEGQLRIDGVDLPAGSEIQAWVSADLDGTVRANGLEPKSGSQVSVSIPGGLGGI